MNSVLTIHSKLLFWMSRLPLTLFLKNKLGKNRAKRLQQWRAILARDAGCTVSINIAPATATQSVVHNKSFAAAYGGMRAFKPMEIFYQEVRGFGYFKGLCEKVKGLGLSAREEREEREER